MSNRNYPRVGYPYIKISLANGFGLTWRLKDDRPDYFTSMTHSRHADKANTAVFNLTYAPQKGDDPNAIEDAIVKSQGICVYQYGIAGQRSKVYRGLIYDYSASMSNGSILYTISLISESVLYTFKTIQDARFVLQTVKSPTYVFGDYETTGRLEAVTGTEGVLKFMYDIVDTFMSSRYVFDIESSDDNFHRPSAEIGCVGKSPLQSIKEIANILVDKTDPTKYFYKIEINDDLTKNNDKGVITLRRYSSDSSRLRYSFDWNSKNANVISWNPQYKGAAFIFNNSSEGKEIRKSIISTFTPNSDGSQNIVSYELPEALKSLVEGRGEIPWDGGSLHNTVQSEINWYEEEKNYCYTAELVVLGVPDNIDLCKTVIEVHPYINGIEHKSGGLYVVKGVTDTVDSQGFITKLLLYKYNSDQVKREDGNYYVYRKDKDGKETKILITDVTVTSEGQIKDE